MRPYFCFQRRGREKEERKEKKEEVRNRHGAAGAAVAVNVCCRGGRLVPERPGWVGSG
jgi:hypothetical protein